jgi:YVTN family beta-propeller protein
VSIPESLPEVTLSAAFGTVTVNTVTGGVTGLFLRDPDGSLPGPSLTGTNVIGTSVTDDTGRRYVSALGSPAGAVVRRDRAGAVTAVELNGLPLTASPLAASADVGQQPHSVAFSADGKTAYVTHYGGGAVSAVSGPWDSPGGAATPISVGGSPSGIAVTTDGDPLVADYAGHTLRQVDPSTRSVVKTIPVGKNPQWPAITPDGKTVLVPAGGSDSVTAVDIASGTVRATIPVGGTPTDIAMSPGGTRAYVTNLSSGTVTPIDLATLQPLPAIPVGGGPVSATATPDGQHIVISLSRAGAVVLLSVATGAVSAPVSVGGDPYGIAVSPDSSIAYVNVAPGTVVPVDLAARAALPAWPAGNFPTGIAISPDGRYLLSADYSGSAVSRYDLGQAPPSPVTEDWVLAIADGGQALRWTITQHWQRDFPGGADAGPSIPFAPAITSTVWHDPAKMYSPSPDTPPYRSARTADYSQVLGSTGQGPAAGGSSPVPVWATYKLWSRYHLASDLRLGVHGGYLTKSETKYGYVSHAGATFEPGDSSTVPAETTRSLTLTLAASDKHTTGYQLDASIPDTAALRSLRDFYQSLLNGGAVAGQQSYLLGNEVAGYITGYAALPCGTALNVGVPSARPASSDPYPLDAAFRNYLISMLDSVAGDGKLIFGLSSGGRYQDAALWALLGLYQYTIHTADLALFRDYQPAIARILSFWTGKIQRNGLVLSSASDGNYYDAVNFGDSYYSTYINAFVHEVLVNMADLERALSEQDAAAGPAEQARRERMTAEGYEATAARIKDAMNAALWTPDSPHGPMYADWINNDSGEREYCFTDAAQYPPIAFGIASRAQAEQILSTADARLAQLPSLTGYTGMGTPSVLWPLPAYANINGYDFGVYMNGGMFLYVTYYEVVARAMTGDADGAYARLKGFTQGFQDNSWWATNWAHPSGALENPHGNEPYLLDMLLTVASLTQGILGIRGTWGRLSVTPAMPSGWEQAQARIIYRGKPHSVTISNGTATITPGTASSGSG